MIVLTGAPVPLAAAGDVLRSRLVSQRDYATVSLIWLAPWISRFGLALLMLAGAIPVSLVALLLSFHIASAIGAIYSYMKADVDFTSTSMVLDLRKKLLGLTLRNSVGSFSRFAQNRIDQVLLLSLVSAEATGYYAIAVTIHEIPIGFARWLRNITLSDYAGDQQRSSLHSLLCIAVAFTVVGGLLGTAAAGWAIPLVFGQEFTPAVAPVQVLLLTSSFSVARVLLGGLLLIDERPELESISQIVGLGVMVVTILVLAPRFGELGAAFSLLAGSAVSSGMSYAFYRRFVYGDRLLRSRILGRDDLKAAASLVRT